MPKITLKTLLNRIDSGVFLVDAYGVLYNDSGIFEFAPAAIKALQKKGDVWLVTNNTTNSPPTIAKKLKKRGIHIPTHRIISSGLGLKKDRRMQRLIKKKNVYVFGWEETQSYVLEAGCRAVVENLNEADVIVMGSTLKTHHEAGFQRFKEQLKARPHIPIICCNPDRFVLTQERQRSPVIGWYADTLAKSYPNPVYWIGKPLKNFSMVVKGVLIQVYGRQYNKSTYFFDDNYENVLAMQNDLSIAGVCILETGLSWQQNLVDAAHEFGKKPDYLLSRLADAD